ncbi:MAG: acylphosphatase [Mariniphaga sp.]|nr:acylphosphatase [Mariniphaga sp.]
MQQLEIKVTGKVQGVGFRYFVKNKANEFDIKGWVRNTNDGGVFIVAEGEESDINTFVDWVNQGPQLSRIDKLTINRFDKLSRFKVFEIRF